jgi:glycosyltransferase involved in cell wall biosynthesis
LQEQTVTEQIVSGPTVTGQIVSGQTKAGVVVIGRNEGERLKRCLASVLAQHAGPVVYVDSGSSDGSVEHAKSVGVEVVDLDMTRPFTMARGRNAGLDYLLEHYPGCEFVQFVDGDCEMAAGWISTALDFLAAHPATIAVCGNRSERYAQASLYNRLINMEWQGSEGEVSACGGDAMYRLKPLASAKGFNPAMIAGEEGELCLRLRDLGHAINRLNISMTLHDADMHRFVQWWCRSVRCGHAYAHGFDLHRHHPEGYKRHQVISSMMYGVFCPLVVLLLICLLLTQSFSMIPFIFILSAILFVVSLYVRIIEICFKSRFALGNPRSQALLYGLFIALGKVPEAQGVCKYYFNKMRGVTAKIIEYRAS